MSIAGSLGPRLVCQVYVLPDPRSGNEYTRHFCTHPRYYSIHTVIGHVHSSAGVQYLASKRDLIFGMNVGCGIDIKSYAMAYGKNFANRPVLGCGVVQGGQDASFVPMLIGV